MSTRLRTHFTAENVLSTIAVFLALAGSSYAALKLPRNSVKSKQVAARAVRSSEAHALRLSDLRSTERRRLAGAAVAAAGPRGEQGTPGLSGAPGPRHLVYVGRRSPTAANDQSPIDFRCPPGTSGIGGGILTVPPSEFHWVDSSFPLFGDSAGIFDDGWGGLVRNQSATALEAGVWAICAPAASVARG